MDIALYFMDKQTVGHCIFYQYIVSSLVIVVLIIIGDVFSLKLHKFINIHVRDVSVTQNINCIVVIDSYGLWINRLQIITFSISTLWEDWLLLL